MIEVHAGGHITLIFTVEKQERLYRDQGSRGIGFSIDKGVRVRVDRRDPKSTIPSSEYSVGTAPDEPLQMEKGRCTFTIRDMYGQLIDDASMYELFTEACLDIGLIKSHESFAFEIDIECPMSQGFGMSAAGLISLGKAIQASTRRGTQEQFLKIAHRIERMMSGGLGDVLGASVGGVELRLAPGAPGWPGKAISFGLEEKILLVWNESEKRHTSKYIDDEQWMTKITTAGNQCLSHYSARDWSEQRWDEILLHSKQFGERSGLESEPIRRDLLNTIQSCIQQHGLSDLVESRLCMLGNSVVLVPKTLNQSTEDWQIVLEESVLQHGLNAMIAQITPLM
jgi:pantoate kinase